MDEEVLNLGIRKFLKRFGVGAQRAIETAVREGLESGALKDDEPLRLRARLTIEGLDSEFSVDDEIRLA